MVLGERARRTLHTRLEVVLGSEEALILMEHLPSGAERRGDPP
jgi:hypothetical protein